MSTTLTAELNALSPSQKMEVIEVLWESMDAAVALPVPEWHLEELQRRAALHSADPLAGTPWPEVKARLLSSHA